MLPQRVVVGVCIVVLFFFAMRFKNMIEPRASITQPFPLPHSTDPIKAAYVMLLRPENRSVNLAIRALSSLERSFNHRVHYPVVIFHEGDEMEGEYGSFIKTQSSFSGNLIFQRVDFVIPGNLDVALIPPLVEAYQRNFSVGYRHMCRFYAGQIFTMRVLEQFDWLWRIDDDSMYICEIPYDPIRVMMENGMKYGFGVEWHEADPFVVKGLWEATKEYASEQGIGYFRFDGFRNLMGGYTECHFWNNFEILNLKFFRGEYMKYFNYVDDLGGIYYKRWGDAIIRTLGVLMYAKENEIHQFTDIGYFHANSCNNHCGWKPPPGAPYEYRELRNGRDETCNTPMRFYLEMPFNIFKVLKSVVMLICFFILLKKLPVIVYGWKRDWVIYKSINSKSQDE